MLTLVGCGGASGSSSNTSTATTGAFMRVDLKAGAVQAAAAADGVASASVLWLKREPDGSYWAIWPVTKGQWLTVMGTQPWSTVEAQFPSTGGTLAPAYNVSQADAKAFVNQVKSLTGVAIDLPKLAEYAALGNADGYPWSVTTRSETAQYAWLHDITSCTGPVAVGTALPSSGLYDLIGNVRVWTSDTPPVLVGGSWADNLASSKLNSAIRSVDPDLRHPKSGFRLLVRN